MVWFLGIDTSCYTTSLAIVDQEGRLLADKRKVLEVPGGEGGLQQSAALFQHIHNLPRLMEDLAREVPLERVTGVAASIKPRPVAESYMPVFKAGEMLGRSLAAALGLPFLPATHQEGHLMAGLWSGGGPHASRFLAVHLSGGTTELLRVERKERENSFFVLDLLGGTADLHAGQLVDRVGVALGLPFPAGPQLEKLGREFCEKAHIPSSVAGYRISFSGPETAARRLLEKGVRPADIARGIEHCIAVSLEKILRRAVDEQAVKEILLVGGVAANRYLRERLTLRLEHPAVGAKLYFAEPRFSTDNAVGVALLGREFWKNNS